MPDSGANFWLDTTVLKCKALGGGNSRLNPACRRALRLDGAFKASRDVPIGRGIATEARLNGGEGFDAQSLILMGKIGQWSEPTVRIDAV
jgi:hypothetical protein